MVWVLKSQPMIIQQFWAHLEFDRLSRTIIRIDFITHWIYCKLLDFFVNRSLIQCFEETNSIFLVAPLLYCSDLYTEKKTGEILKVTSTKLEYDIFSSWYLFKCIQKSTTVISCMFNICSTIAQLMTNSICEMSSNFI